MHYCIESRFVKVCFYDIRDWSEDFTEIFTPIQLLISYFQSANFTTLNITSKE